MNSFIETLNQWGGNFSDFARPMLWQSSLLIAVLLAFDFLFQRKLRASIRYALWLVVLAKLCVPPTLALPTSPAWWLRKIPPPVVAKSEAPHYTVTYDDTPMPAIPQTPPPVFVPPKPAMTFAAWLLMISAAVSSALFLWLLLRWWQITLQVRRAKTSERLAALVGEAQKFSGIKFSVPVKLTANSMSPAVCGLFRPAILIPQSLAENFSDEQLRAVLLHELIHLRRRDVWLNFLQALLQIFYWWYPLVWLANARIRRVREEAVDDAVMLAFRGDAEIYAPTLLEVAKLALNRPLASLGLVGILESRHALRQRIERLVDFRPPRKAGLTLVSLIGILAFTAVAVPMGGAPEETNNSTLPGSSENLNQTNSSVSTTNNFPSPANTFESKAKADELERDGQSLYEMGKLDEAEVKLKSALSLDSENGAAKYYLGLVESARQSPRIIQTSHGREKIVEKLDHIWLAKISYGDKSAGQPLSEVLRDLAEKVKANDPDKKGINFLIYPNDVNTSIKMPGLTNVRLVDVMDAIVLTADKPIKYSIMDYGVVFSAKTPDEIAEEAKLFTRTFNVDPNRFENALQKATGLQTKNVPTMARIIFKTMGVDLDLPGKNIFFNDRLGMLYVRATKSDLDTIERAISALDAAPPLIHIKARFVEVTQDDSKTSGTDWYLGHFGSNNVGGNGGNSPSLTMTVSEPNPSGAFPGNTTSSTEVPQNSDTAMTSVTGILTETNYWVVLHALEQRVRSEILAEPEVTTTSGRQTQMRATTIITVVTNLAFEEDRTNGMVVPQMANIEFGPVLDTVANVLADGYTIDLRITASFTEFLGYDETTNTTAHYTKTGIKVDVPDVLPRIETRQASAHLNVWDGQTVVLGGMIIPSIQTTKDKVPFLGDLPGIGRLFRSQSKTKIKQNLMVFVTATIVDTAGNRIHSDDEMPFAKDEVPTQPNH